MCDAFLKRVVDSGVSVVTSELLRIELAEAALAIAMKERRGRRWRAHRTDGRSRRRAARQPLGLPRWSTGGMSRYRISEVEAWLRERYGSTAETP